MACSGEVKAQVKAALRARKQQEARTKSAHYDDDVLIGSRGDNSGKSAKETFVDRQ